MAENIHRLNFTGIEISTDVRVLHDDQVQLVYTELYGVEEALIRGLQTKYAFDYPAHEGVVAFSGRLPGKLAARTRLGVVERFSSDPYGLWDLGVVRELSLGSSPSALKITDAQYREIPGVVMPGHSVVFGLDFCWHGR
jgi:hypothetical protein